MMHLTDEEMIGQTYGESESTAAVEQHLAACRACAQNFAELRRDLAALDRVQAPARDERYGEQVWASISPSLPVYGLRFGHRLAGFLCLLRGPGLGAASPPRHDGRETNAGPAA